MEENTSDDELKTQGVTNRKLLYSRASKYAPKAIKILADLLDSRNEGIRLGAAKTLLARVLPDLKAQEISGKDGEAITINLISDYLSRPVVVAAPETGFEGSDKV